MLFVPHDTKTVLIAYISPHNFTKKHHITLLRITDDEKFHYLSVKSISRLLQRISSKHKGDYSCLGCFNSYRTKEKLIKHDRLCRNPDYCAITFTKEKYKYYKYDIKNFMVPFIIIGDFEAFNVPCKQTKVTNENKSYANIEIHQVACGYSLLTSHTNIINHNKHTVYRGEDCLEKFAYDLKDHVDHILSIKCTLPM